MYQTNADNYTESSSQNTALKNTNNNKVFISGLIESELIFDHDVFGEAFYLTKIKVIRQSGNMDILPVIISERLLYNYGNESLKDRYIEVIGEIRSYNRSDENKYSHLKVCLFALGVKIYEDDDYEEFEGDSNSVYLRGVICKIPNYRTTPFGREIVDLMLAVNRKYGKTSYIPCIAWGRTARFMTNFDVGTEIEVYGRFQSREYVKVLSEEFNISETRVAYEISAARVNVIKNLE